MSIQALTYNFEEFNTVDYHTKMIDSYHDRLVKIGQEMGMTEDDTEDYMETRPNNASRQMTECYDLRELHLRIRDLFDITNVTTDGYCFHPHYLDLMVYIIKHRSTLPDELIGWIVEWYSRRQRIDN